MIKLYLRNKGDSSTRRTISWFEQHLIPFEYYPISKINEEDLRKILQLSDGFLPLLRSKNQAVYKNLDERLDFSQASTEDLVNYILRHPVILRSPIAFNNKKLLIGYNDVEIRQFIPKNYRKIDFYQRSKIFIDNDSII